MTTLPAPLDFGTIAIIGIGLQGASLARKLLALGANVSITVCDTNPEHLKQAKAMGLGARYTLDAAEAVVDADLVVIATPLSAMVEVAEAISGALRPGTVVTDTGSAKLSVIRDLSPHMPEGVHLVPGHPVAGTEHSGPAAGFAELFEGRWCVLTPLAETDPAAIERVASLWRACGSSVEIMDAKHHDTVLAITSHLPHLIAYTIVGTATDLEDHLRQEVVKFSASGFRDFTRIAASDPVMWRDVFLNNREAVLDVLQRFSEDLTRLQRAIRWGEGDVLFDLFTRTRTIHRDVIDAKQAWSSRPDTDLS